MTYVLDGPMKGKHYAIPERQSFAVFNRATEPIQTFGDYPHKPIIQRTEYRKVRFSSCEYVDERKHGCAKSIIKTWEFLTCYPEHVDNKEAERMTRELPPTRIEDRYAIWGPMWVSEARVLRALCLMEKYRLAGKPMSKKLRRFDWRYRQPELFRLRTRGYIDCMNQPTQHGKEADERAYKI